VRGIVTTSRPNYDRETLLDELYDHLVKTWSLKCADAMRSLSRDLCVMTNEELRDLSQELLSEEFV